MTTMKWRCREPRYWAATDGTHTATATKVREGIIHSSEWMWVTRLNGEWIDNANTLADAKAAVAKALDA